MNPDPRHDDQLKRDMLPRLLTELERTRRKRVVRARFAAVSSAAALVTLAVIGALVTLPASRAPIHIPLDTATGPAPTPITIVRSDPASLGRWTVRTDPGALVAASTPMHPSTTAIEILDDRRLLDLLASIGRPAGLVRSGGRTWLTREVTDPLPESPG